MQLSEFSLMTSNLHRRIVISTNVVNAEYDKHKSVHKLILNYILTINAIISILATLVCHWWELSLNLQKRLDM